MAVVSGMQSPAADIHCIAIHLKEEERKKINKKRTSAAYFPQSISYNLKL